MNDQFRKITQILDKLDKAIEKDAAPALERITKMLEDTPELKAVLDATMSVFGAQHDEPEEVQKHPHDADDDTLLKVPTLNVEFIGGPCCGKSQTSALVFGLLKNKQEISVELCTEAVKDFVYDNNQAALSDQLLITATQNHKVERLQGKVQVVVSDCSMLNGVVYNKFYNKDGQSRLSDMVDDLSIRLFHDYNPMLVLLPRKPKYDTYGRTQSAGEAEELDQIVLDTLLEMGIPFLDMRAYKHADIPEIMVSVIEAEIKAREMRNKRSRV